MGPSALPQQPYVLGLDIGQASIGWAALACPEEEPAGLIALGVRVFDAGIEESDFEQGKENSRNAHRRQMRLARRMINRRMRRQKRLFRALSEAGLLPTGSPHEVIPALDAALLRGHLARLPNDSADRHRLAQVLPYHLRALALREKLQPFELGRALYHLGQRRGYKSNSKAPPRKDEKAGKVEAGISQLEQEMAAAGAPTLGAYFASLDPHQRRIRHRWTSRAMYEAEFEKIWTAQAPHHPGILTDDLKKKVRRAIFRQRPLRNQHHLLGTCEFEPGRKRAPKALLVSQRFRLLQQVNNVRLTSRDGQSRELTADERDKLIDKLEREGDLEFTAAKKLLGLKQSDQFNWESGGEKRFLGNRTNEKLAEVFGDRWWQFSASERDCIVEDVLSIQDEAALQRRGEKRWGLKGDAAKKFGQLALEPGYLSLSRKAISKLLPCLEDGLTYPAAVEVVYGKRSPQQPRKDLPIPALTYRHLRNPLVLRVLSELRKVVNALIRRYGIPKAIRIELGRDLRRSAKERKDAWNRMRENERLRAQAAEKIINETSNKVPTRADVEKVLLAEECRWICPYTGRAFGMNDLFGSTPTMDVEHIIPFSRCLDDSFLNKTLCDVEENRNVKRNRTPFEAYGNDPQRWHQILGRVRNFSGSAARAKLERFMLESLEGLDDFATRSLNDTRYAARLATEYLGMLYGGMVDAEGKRRVQASKGQVTAFLRNEFQLNSILGDGGTKTRDDHRHHAIDAVAIALADARTVKLLSDAAARAPSEGRRRFGRIDPPWHGFLDDVRSAIEQVVVSHRVSRKVNGPLHEDTNYAPSRQVGPDGKPLFFTVRKRLDDLSPGEIENIADNRVRQLVKDRLAELGGPPSKAFKNQQNHPFFVTRDGRHIHIHCVRIRKADRAEPIGQGPRRRWVISGSNHHVEVFKCPDKKGKPRWEGRLVTRRQAMRRLAERLPIVDRTLPQGAEKFLFSLGCGDLIELDSENGQRTVRVIRSVSQTQKGYIIVEHVSLNDGRKKVDIKKDKKWRASPLNTLAAMHCQKVTVTPLGEVRRASD